MNYPTLRKMLAIMDDGMIAAGSFAEGLNWPAHSDELEASAKALTPKQRKAMAEGDDLNPDYLKITIKQRDALDQFLNDVFEGVYYSH